MSRNSSTGIPLRECTIYTCPLSDAAIEYVPSLGGNVFFAIVFAAILAGQIYFGARYRTWSFLGGMVPGLLLEIIGYIGRIMLHNNPFVMNNFLVYLICLTIGPAFLTASIYLCLSRIVTICGAQHSRLSPKQYTVMFICFDVLALLLQAVGGALASTAKDHAGSLVGTRVMIAGLVWQVISMTLFLGLWGDFVLCVKRSRKSGGSTGPGQFSKLRDRRSFGYFQISLATATVAIFIRSIYRIAELQGGFKGAIANNEAAFMIFEGPLIIIACALLTGLHPGRVFDGLWVSTGQGSKLGNEDDFTLHAPRPTI